MYQATKAIIRNVNGRALAALRPAATRPAQMRQPLGATADSNLLIDTRAAGHLLSSPQGLNHFPAAAQTAIAQACRELIRAQRTPHHPAGLDPDSFDQRLPAKGATRRISTSSDASTPATTLLGARLLSGSELFP